MQEQSIERGRGRKLNGNGVTICIGEQRYGLPGVSVPELNVALGADDEAGTVRIELQGVLGAVVRILAKDPNADEPIRF